MSQRNGYHINNMGVADEEMLIKEYGVYFDGIEENETALIEKLLRDCTTQERNRMLNGKFVFALKTKNICDDKKLPCAFFRPLLIAVIFLSEEVLDVFLEWKINLYTRDLGGCNVIHAIVWGASLKPIQEENYLKLYVKLMEPLTSEKRMQLLFEENDEGLRPLELATRLCTFHLAQKIIDTEGVYSFQQGRYGAYMCTRFDVTDYEGGSLESRRDKSPLKMLILLEKEHAKQAQTSKILEHPAFQQWVNIKINASVLVLVLWFFIRLVYTGLFFVCATSDDEKNLKQYLSALNTTGIDEKSLQNCPRPLFNIDNWYTMVITIIVLIYSAVVVIFDTFDVLLHFIRKKKVTSLLYHPDGSRNFVARTRFNRFCNFFLALSVLLFLSSRIPKMFFGSNTQPVSGLTSKVYILANILNIWSLLYFIQFLPAFGYFVIIIQRMLKDMINFLILYIILFFSFSQTFYNLFYMHKTCTQDFNTVTWSMYSTFRIMLNMVEFIDFPVKDMTDVAILHTTYVIIVPILLINFLIALMSNSVSEVAESRHLIMTLQRLSAALLVEGRLGAVLRFFRIRQNSRHFLIEDDRVFVEYFILKGRT